MKRALIAVAVLVSVVASAGFTPSASCTDEYALGAAPKNVASKYAAAARSVCYSEYGVLVSTQTFTPLWSAEHLTRADVMAARKLQRVDRFHAEPNLPKTARAELADYNKSGFDRGHMAPSGDMPTPIAQGESFSLANIAPQDATLNRGAWSEIEEDVRRLAVSSGELYVVTGPLFDVGAAPKLNGRVNIPAAFYKAIYDPKTGKTGAYVAWNEDEPRIVVVSVARLRAASGFDPFPAVSEAAKASPMALPQPGVSAQASLPSTRSALR